MGFVAHLVCQWCDLGYYRNTSTALDPDTYCSGECEGDDPDQ